MKVIANRIDLLDKLEMCCKISARNGKPALQCVLIKAESPNMSMSATDLEMHLSVSTSQVQVEQPGACLVPAAALRNCVSLMADNVISISLEEMSVVIKGDSSTFKLNTCNTSDFPLPPDVDFVDVIRMTGKDFSTICDQVAYAASNAGTRYAFDGVFVDAMPGVTSFTATDGHRLASRTIKDGNAKGSAIVPTKAIRATSAIVDKSEVVRLSISTNHISFESESFRLIAVVIEGTFPGWRAMIPSEHDVFAAPNADDLANAMRQTMVVADDVTNGIHLSGSSAGLECLCRTQNGEVNARIPCKYDGDPIEIGINPEYVLDAITSCGSDIAIEMTKPNRPVVFRGQDVVCVVMPVSIK